MMLLPSTPNTAEGVFADWSIYALRALHTLTDEQRFTVFADVALVAFERAVGVRTTPQRAAAFIDDLAASFDDLVVLRDPSTARAGFLMAFLRAARSLQ